MLYTSESVCFCPNQYSPSGYYENLALLEAKYLGRCLFLTANNEAQFKEYSDSDWTSCANTRKYVT